MIYFLAVLMLTTSALTKNEIEMSNEMESEESKFENKGN